MTTARKQAVRLRDVARYADPEFKASLLAGAEALEAQEVKVTRVMDPEAAAYHARIATHCDRLEAIQERIAKALEQPAKGRWYHFTLGDQHYMIPVEHWPEWDKFLHMMSPDDLGFPEWAVPVEDDVVVTGWEG